MKIVICMAVFNEEKSIDKAIRSLISAAPEKDDIQLLIVSSGSTDNTNHRISEFINQGYPITLFEEIERRGKASALNLFFKNASLKQADLCIFTDGDILLDPDSISALVSRFNREPNLDVVCGNPVAIVNTINNFWEKVAIENCIIWDLTRRRLAAKNQVWPLTGYLFAVKPHFLPFNIPIDLAADDAYIGWQILQKGGKMGYESSAVVRVHFPTNLKDYFIQKTRTRYGWYQIKKYANSEYYDLQSTRQSIFLSRICSGYGMSLLCWLLDKTVWLGTLSFLRRHNGHIWDQVLSTKL